MSVSFEDALGTLTSMFPEWDRETLSALLTSNGYHVERTIENVLSMSGEMSAEEQLQQQQQQQQRASFTSSQNNGPVAAPGSSTSTSAPPRRSRRKGPRVNTDKDAPYRGIRQELPDDFLRPPTGKGGPIIADEELALMLQNELFQKEVQRMLGDEFFQEQRQRGANTTGNGGSNSRRGSKAGGEDLGILKALSSMGSAAKKNLSSLAERFQGKNSTNNPNTQHVMQYGESAGESGTSREFKSLVGGNDDDDDEEDEVISFGGSSAGSRAHILDDEPSSNPLIQAGGANTINGGKKNK